MERLIRSWGLAVLLWMIFIPAASAEDVRLADLMDEALRNNPEIRTAEAQAASAAQRISREASLPDPVLSAGYQNEGFKRYTYGESQFSWWMFSLSQTFPFPGKRSLQREAASYEAESAKAAAERIRREVVGRVRQAYYDLFLADRELDLIRERKPLASKLEEAALARYAAGTGTQEDVIMAQSAKYMLLENESMAISRRESAEAAIRRETGRTGLTPLGRPVETPPTPFGYTLEELVGKASANSPELAERQRMVLVSEKRLSRAEREAWPDITLMPQYFSLGDGMEDMWALTASIPLPVFYRQKQGAAIAESSWSLVSSRKELESARLKVESEIRDNLATISASDKVIDLYRNALIPKARQNIDAAIALFSAGRMNAYEALSALKAPFDYELTLWQQRMQREKAIARIKVLTGDMEDGT
ncbi:MAG TPA: TolC family protein [Deltaproteobacteria bacterium]|jgi:outer membrane protein TolC|nr:TolC family protein [Deltaproteobacteria bacterium]HQI00597.1 TolC family protein [Deltaproteobacteria bacterium]